MTQEDIKLILQTIKPHHLCYVLRYTNNGKYKQSHMGWVSDISTTHISISDLKIDIDTIIKIYNLSTPMDQAVSDKLTITLEKIQPILNQNYDLAYTNRIQALLDNFKDQLSDNSFEIFFATPEVLPHIGNILQDITGFKNWKQFINHDYNCKVFEHYPTILHNLYTHCPDINNIVADIKTCVNRIKDIYSKSALQLYQERPSTFTEFALNDILLKNVSYNLSPNQLKIIANELQSSSHIDDIIKLLYTFYFTKSTINNFKSLDLLDYTYIAVSLFKMVEITFNELLNKYWSKKTITSLNQLAKKPENRESIDLSIATLELGTMKQFLYCTDPEINNHLSIHKDLVNNLKKVLGRWISKTRNGFLHKDILNHSIIQNSITDSIIVLCLLILVIKKEHI